MNPNRVLSVTGLLIPLLTVACTSPPGAPPTEGAPVPRPTVWLGLALAGEGFSPSSVVRVADAASAAEAGIQAGDVLVHLAGHEISGPAALAETVGTLRAREPVEAVVRRQGEELSLRLDPGVLVFVEDPPSAAVYDKNCDEGCECSVDEPGAICFRRLVYRGEGPNGGTLYWIGCAAVKGEEIVSDRDCGLHEYF